jgi:hypothetical protein
MSPFRDAPQVELGPLDVGLSAAASRAVAALPTGGRLIVLRRPRFAAHLAGALGSTGLFGVLLCAVAAWASRWSPRTVSDLGLCIAAVVVGGGSLAAVLHALDQNARPLTRSGEAVRHSALRVLDRLVVLADRAERSPSGLTDRHAAGLQRALASAESPDLAPWISDDVRGRAELLLARMNAARGGHAWAADDTRRDRVRALLASAAQRLTDPDPARRDLAALDAAPRNLRLRVLAEPAESDAYDDVDDTASAPAAILRKL